MIFSQTQQQAILILLGCLLLLFSIFSSPSIRDIHSLKEVNPKLLESRREKVDFPSQQKTRFTSQRKATYSQKRVAKSHRIKPLPKVQKPAIQAVDLNNADSTALDAIPGIGPTLAKRILKYRSLIGRFIEVEQLKLVYGLSIENYNRMAPHFVLKAHEVKPEKDLNSEKSYRIAWFIGKEKAKLLVELRKAKGWFEDWKGVEEADFLDKRDIRWLKAYFFIK